MKRFVILAVLALGAAHGITPETQATVDALCGRADAPADYPAAVQEVLDALVADFASDDINTQFTSRTAWEQVGMHAARPGAEAERLAFCQVSLSKLTPGVPTWSQVWILRQLQNVGGGEVVPRLAELLGNQDELIAEHALLALANNPSAEAAGALRDALAAATDSAGRIALINALGFRADAAAMPALTGLLGDGDEQVIIAAADALGRIGTAEAATALAAARGNVAGEAVRRIDDATLKCADKLAAGGARDQAVAIYRAAFGVDRDLRTRSAALRGLGLTLGGEAAQLVIEVLGGDEAELQPVAGRLVVDIPGEAATRAFADQLPGLQPPMQVVLLGALAERGDPAALPRIAEQFASANEEVAVAAVDAGAALGNEALVPSLVALATGEQPRLRDAARGALTRLRGAAVDPAIAAALDGAPNATVTMLAAVLAERHASAAVPALIATAGRLTDNRTLSAVYRAMVQAAGEAQRDAVRDALRTALGGDAARQRGALAGYEVWPNDAPMDELLALSRGAEDEIVRTLALQQYLRMFGMSERTAAERLARYQELLAATQSEDEAAVVLEAIGEVPTIEALRAAEARLPATAAAQAVINIARELAMTHREAATAALEAIAANAQDGAVKAQAGAVLEQLKALGAYLTDWLFAGPYTQGNQNNLQLYDTVFDPEKPDAEVTWQRLEWAVDGNEPWRVNLDQSPWNGNNRACYARTRVFAPAAGPVQFELGSDDGAKVWLNGTVVHEQNVNRAHATGSDKFTAELRQGWNVVMIKITQGGGQWALSLRIVTPEGTVIDGLRVQAEEE